jgi:hypothetical protein
LPDLAEGCGDTQNGKTTQSQAIQTPQHLPLLQLEAQAESLARKSIARQEREMTNRAVSVMQGLNVSDVLLAEEDSLAEHLDRARKQLAAELEAAGRGQPSPAAAGSTGGGSSSGGGKPGRRQQ